MTCRGKIIKLKDKRYGFIQVEGGDSNDDVYFNKSFLKNIRFEELKKDDLVEFVLVETRDGRFQAKNIEKLFKSAKEYKKKNKKKEKFANAPYNFVPLNKDVIEGTKCTPNNIFDNDRKSGFIDCKLETLTPLFIGDGNDPKGTKNLLTFFEPTGIPIIPGSSLRGMIRSIMEIVTFGKFVNFDDDKTLYYRTFADMSNKMKIMYAEQMSDQEQKKSITLAGYLRKEGLNYFIQPAKTDENGKTYKNISHEELREKNIQFRDLKDLQFQHFEAQNSEDNFGGYYVISGAMGSKESERHVFPPDEEEPRIEISPHDIEDYRKDKDRTAIINLLTKIEKTSHKDGIPCFYIQWVDEDSKDRISFGHTALFRKAYQRPIGKAVPQNLKDNSLIDFTESIFGIAKSKNNNNEEQGFSGRVAFSDAIPSSKVELMDEAVVKTLSSPKPTSIQLYLEQNCENYNLDKIKTYNDEDAVIRGYKHYWHKSGDNWKKPSIEKFRKNLDKSITPVKEGAEFEFRIWFNNLTDIELGSLLFCINLDESLGLKLGMGKPVGLGSVKIKSQLYSINRKSRYTKLFDLENKTWNLQISVEKSDAEVYDFITVFENYILENLSNDLEDKELNSLWDAPRLQKLRLLLDIEHGIKIENEGKIDYMDLQEYRKRNRLPHPDEI